MNFQCEECFNGEYQEILGSGTDSRGDFTDYECSECNQVTRIFDNE